MTDTLSERPGRLDDLEPPALPPLRRMTRPRRGRVLAGVAAGFAEHLGLPVARVRVGFAAFSLFGIGAVAYLLLWVLTPPGPGASDPAAATTATPPGGARTSMRVLLVGLACLGLGLAVAMAVNASEVLNPGTLLPLAAVIGGAVVAWSQLDDDDAREPGQHPRFEVSRRQAMLRLGIGTTLAAGGIVAVATRGQGLSMLWDVIVAALAVVVGVGLILAPWALRFWRRFQLEQSRAIRETERADIAAHLHDSVLQTLALIQRTDDPARVTQLARAQERELRNWLYGKDTTHRATLAAAVADVAAEVEDLHGVPIEVVVTGDAPYDDPAEALVAALREALLNAVRHGAPPVTAYVEAGPRELEAFVRDRGSGFDVDDVPPDRLGVRESIVGRMTRRGGTARVRRMDPGTEVSLCIPVEARGEPASRAGAPTGGEPSQPSEPSTEPSTEASIEPSTEASTVGGTP